MRVLGLMSGTSLDAVDGAVCHLTTRGIALEHLGSVPFPTPLRRRLITLANGSADSWQTAQAHHDLGRFYAQAAAQILGKRRVEAVGLHGQTVFHRPHASRPATLQVGEPAYLAEALHVPVVANFRTGDLAAGGQGAPLATEFHREVFARRGQYVAVNNLGGISNVTALDWSDRRSLAPRVVAFDTGPANLPMDLAMARLTGGRCLLDRDGRWARRGRVYEDLVVRWLRHPFITAAPPKSTGREVFGEGFVDRALALAERRGLSAEDVVATLTRFSAAALAENYRRHLPNRAGRGPEEVVLCGGGASNPALVEAIRLCLGNGVRLHTSAELGWPHQAIEPAAFALLAARRLAGQAGNLPETTGARRPVVLGAIYEGGPVRSSPKSGKSSN